MTPSHPRYAYRLYITLCFCCLAWGCGPSGNAARETDSATDPVKSEFPAKSKVATELPFQQAVKRDPILGSRESRTTSPTIVTAARTQVGRTLIYSAAYVSLDYPGGDLPILKGVCTDVVIRALRDAPGMDLQQLVHEDMKANFLKYPDHWGLNRPDRNIDHRRVPNLQCYFRRMGYEIEVTKNKDDYLPGDIVTCDVPSGSGHIMIVSDRKSRKGVPHVIHNIGWGAREEDSLFEFSLTGHYRIKTEPSNERTEGSQ